MDKFKNSEQKIYQNHKYNNNDQMFINKFQIEKEEDNEIIIELKLSINNKEKEIYILCDKNKLIEDNKRKEDYYKENNINPPKEFNYFNKDNTQLYLNDKQIKFNYKLNFNEIGTYKIKIKSNINLISLSSMFYNCYNIINIKFINFNTYNDTDIY